jgi:hypothetical protein
MTWDQRENAAGRWPRGRWTGTSLVVIAALLTGGGLLAYRVRTEPTPLQRLYLLRYVRSTAFAAAHLPATRYQLLETPGRMLASEADLARTDLRWTNTKLDNAIVRDQFAARIYGSALDDFLLDLAWPALLAALLVFGVGLMLALPHDLRRQRAIRDGVRLRGREKVDAAEFNARTPGDGLRIFLGRGVIRK